VTNTWSQSVSNGGDPHSGAAAWVIDDNTRNLQWSLNGCDTSIHVGAVLRRLQVTAAVNAAVAADAAAE
jgi:hypothetical protein